MDSLDHVRVLLRSGADRGQHHCGVLPRSVQPQSVQRWNHCVQLRVHEHCFSAAGRDSVGHCGGEVRNAGTVVELMDHPDAGRRVLHYSGQDGCAGACHRGHDRVFVLRSGRLRSHVRSDSVRVPAVAGRDLGVHRGGRQPGCGDDADDILHAGDVPHGGGDRVHGHHDHLRHGVGVVRVVPSVGRHGLPVVEDVGGGLLRVGVQRRGAGSGDA